MPSKSPKGARTPKRRSPEKSTFPNLPPGRVVLTQQDVCERYFYKRHTLRNAILAGQFPAPVRLTPLGHPRWFLVDLEAFDNERRAAARSERAA